MRNHALSCVLGVVLLACSSSTGGSGGGSGNRVALDANALCDRLINECKQPLTAQQCDLAISILRLTPECAAKINSDTCEGLNTSFNGTDEECFPSCTTPGSQSCNGDGTMTSCSSSSKTLVLDCEATCQKASSPPKTFSGTCGTEFAGQRSSDGEEKCWCK